MNGANETKAITGAFLRLDMNDVTKHSFPNDTGPIRTTNIEQAKIWESDTWRACIQGRSADVKVELAKLGPQAVSRFVNARDRSGNTALIVTSAATHKNIACAAVIPILLGLGADINTKNEEGRTAVMEAALWGGLAAVEALLDWKQGTLADVTLKDNSGRGAIDLAKKDERLVAERRKRCFNGENVETRFYGKLRSSVVRRLRSVGNEEKMSTSSRHTVITKPTKNYKEDSDAKLLKKTQAKLKNVEGLASRHLNELQETKKKLREEEERSEKWHSKYNKAQGDMNDVFAKHGPLSRSKVNGADHKPQFRITTESIEPPLFKFDFLQTFDVSPKNKESTMAYMRINEKHYFAKTGESHDVLDGFVSGRKYTEEACQLFRPLGFEHNVTWFQHAEPQLMALFVEHFRSITGLSMQQFRSRQGPASGTECYVPRVVEIFTSREPCWTCVSLEGLVNKAARRHGFSFSLIYSPCEQ
jgi:hypothetical protein